MKRRSVRVAGVALVAIVLTGCPFLGEEDPRGDETLCDLAPDECIPSGYTGQVYGPTIEDRP